MERRREHEVPGSEVEDIGGGPRGRHDVARPPQHTGDGEVEGRSVGHDGAEVVDGLELLGADAGETQRVPGTDAVGRRQLLVDADLQLLVEVGRAAFDDPRIAHAVQHPAVRGAERVEVAEAGGVRTRRIVGHEEEVLPALGVQDRRLGDERVPVEAGAEGDRVSGVEGREEAVHGRRRSLPRGDGEDGGAAADRDAARSAPAIPATDAGAEPGRGR